jgi:FkbM family methyltransferase
LNDLAFKILANQFAFFHVALRVYFKERKNYKITSVQNEVIMKIDDLTFFIPFPNGIFEVLEIFRDKIYAGFNVKGKSVIDVGCFIGESALYFAKQGAKRVTAFEPVPQLFKLAQKNVECNNYHEKVDIRNYAVSDESGIKTLNFNPYWPSMSSMVKENKFTQICPVKTQSLNSIINELEEVALLKIDCEGLEYKLIEHIYKANLFVNIDQVCIEVHGSPQAIVDILKLAKFNVEFSIYGPNFLLKAKKIDI